jgi:hypothetical protein
VEAELGRESHIHGNMTRRRDRLHRDWASILISDYDGIGAAAEGYGYCLLPLKTVITP